MCQFHFYLSAGGGNMFDWLHDIISNYDAENLRSAGFYHRIYTGRIMPRFG